MPKFTVTHPIAVSPTGEPVSHRDFCLESNAKVYFRARLRQFARAGFTVTEGIKDTLVFLEKDDVTYKMEVQSVSREDEDSPASCAGAETSAAPRSSLLL